MQLTRIFTDASKARKIFPHLSRKKVLRFACPLLFYTLAVHVVVASSSAAPEASAEGSNEMTDVDIDLTLIEDDDVTGYETPDDQPIIARTVHHFGRLIREQRAADKKGLSPDVDEDPSEEPLH